MPFVGPKGNDGNDCYSHCPTTCGSHDMMCPGGADDNGCPMPDFCMPSDGPVGTDGNACPSTCPTMCGPEEVWCSGGYDSNNCEMPNTCMPMKGTLYISLLNTWITIIGICDIAFCRSNNNLLFPFPFFRWVPSKLSGKSSLWKSNTFIKLDKRHIFYVTHNYFHEKY